MNTYGKNFTITIFGESHGPFAGVVIDGIKPGIKLSEEDFKADLERRKNGDIPSLSKGVTARQEEDIPIFISGLLDGVATGAPLAILFENRNQQSKDYSAFKDQPRPSHADFAAFSKFKGFNDIRGGGMFSGRMTLPLVAAGTVARKSLENAGFNITFKAVISAIGGNKDADKWEEIISSAKAEGDSLGGEIICRIDGVPAGKGAPFFDSMESQIAHLAFSVPGVKGIQFGDFSDSPEGKNKASLMKGSEFNDPIIDSQGHTSTNHSGGINGGLSNGNPIVFTLDIRPAASIAKAQQTFNFKSGKTEKLSIGGRHDACIALRCPVIAESVAAIALADILL
jgi:chorismate synthase